MILMKSQRYSKIRGINDEYCYLVRLVIEVANLSASLLPSAKKSDLPVWDLM